MPVPRFAPTLKISPRFLPFKELAEHCDALWILTTITRSLQKIARGLKVFRAAAQLAN